MSARARDDLAAFVQNKFAAIAPRYDLLNSVLSLGIDSSWRRAVTRQLPVVSYPLVLDVCAGTLPLTRELLKAGGRRVIALDFCQAMLARGRDQIPPGGKRPLLLCADGQRLPLRSEAVNAATVAFGARNLAEPAEGINEMYRVLKPSGRVVILEFSRPDNPLIGLLYKLYLGKILPAIGGLVSGDKEAYSYLASSIGAFMAPQEVARLMARAGFRGVRYLPLTMGIVTLYVGDK
ncbi:MAG: ubiquinone/menaquinone biosynthesis methyltransferase [Pseudomonadota bacterium]